MAADGGAQNTILRPPHLRRNPTMTPFTRSRSLAAVATAALLLAVSPAHAQTTPPAAAPAAAPAPAPPPAWTQGRGKEQESSPLHPHLPQLTGTPAKDIPIQYAKLPPGFKIEI